MSFTATAYCKGTTTAAGTAVRRGIAAADRDVLPPGSVVSLSTGDPEFDGVYTQVLDTGPAVQGHIPSTMELPRSAGIRPPEGQRHDTAARLGSTRQCPEHDGSSTAPQRP